MIAKRALEIPRVAKALKMHAGAWAISTRGSQTEEEQGQPWQVEIEERDVPGACKVLGIDAMGLHAIDRRVLHVLAKRVSP